MRDNIQAINLHRASKMTDGFFVPNGRQVISLITKLALGQFYISLLGNLPISSHRD